MHNETYNPALSNTAPPASAELAPKCASELTRKPVQRLDYLDAARALAIIGMLLTHLETLTQVPEPIFNAASGRSSITFAVLAGISAVLMVRSVNRRRGMGDSGVITRASAWSLTRRALALYVLGLVLVLASSGPIVILCTYAVLLLLAIPLLRIESTKILAALAGVSAVVLPILSFWIRSTFPSAYDVHGVVPMILDFADPIQIGIGIRGLLLDGMYPVLTWIPFLIAGLALGRILLRPEPRFGRVFAVGAVLSVVSYGIHFIVLAKSSYVDDMLATLVENEPSLGNLSHEELLDHFGQLLNFSFGVTDINRPVSLLLAIPHSGSITEILGGIGVVCMLLPVLAWIGTRAPLALRPFSLLGRGALTYYVSHILALTVLAILGVENQNVLLVVVGFVLIPMLIAFLWFKKFRRGPLEAVMHRIAM